MMIEILTSAASAAPSLGSPAEIWAHIVSDFSNIGSPTALAAFAQVLMIDLLLAGDNAIVVGALAAGLPDAQRKRVIMIGIVAALVLRIGFALVVSQLMQIVGLIPLGDDEATCLFHFFHDYPGVRRVIGIDVEDQFSAGALEKRPDIRDALFRVSFGGQRFIGGANGLGEIRAALGEAGVIGICHRAHGIGECPGGFLGNRRHGERTSEHAKRGSAFQNRAAVQAGIHVNGFSLLASHF